MTARSGRVSLPQRLTPGGLSRTKWVAQRRYAYDKFYMDSGGYIYTFIHTQVHMHTCNNHE